MQEELIVLWTEGFQLTFGVIQVSLQDSIHILKGDSIYIPWRGNREAIIIESLLLEELRHQGVYLGFVFVNKGLMFFFYIIY